MSDPKQVSFIPKENGNIELDLIEVKLKPKKPVQASLLEWGKLQEWKGEEHGTQTVSPDRNGRQEWKEE